MEKLTKLHILRGQGSKLRDFNSDGSQKQKPSPRALPLFFVAVFLTCAGAREPSVANKFYPGDKMELTSMVRNFMGAVPQASLISEGDDRSIIGLVAPHAGYVFSGGVAAYAFRQVQGKKYDIVVIIGQSHYHRLNRAALCDEGTFSTPLGKVFVRTDIVKILAGDPCGLFEINNAAHKPEHSIEVELPFLQFALSGDFAIVPVLVGAFSLQECKAIAEKISGALKNSAPGKKILYVISTDMSHYPSYEDAYHNDALAIETLEKLDPVQLSKTTGELMSRGVPSLDCIFCGEQAVITGIYAAKLLGANTVKSLKYSNSGDTPMYGTKDRVVGYYAGAFLKETKTTMEKEFSISPKNQKILLELSRSTIGEYFKTGKVLNFTTSEAELISPAAVFVTLTSGGRLRGCIGTTVPREPLYKAVQNMALAAAFEDHRFPKLTAGELKNIKIEISVLSPLVKVKSADQIKEKVHGVTVRRGARSGLFLPQVWEHFDKKEDFLSELCSQKAGLKPDAWCDPNTEICVFTVFAFEEH